MINATGNESNTFPTKAINCERNNLETKVQNLYNSSWYYVLPESTLAIVAAVIAGCFVARVKFIR